MERDTPAAGDVDGLVLERIIKFRQATIGSGGGGIDFRGALHVEGLSDSPGYEEGYYLLVPTPELVIKHDCECMIALP